MHVYLIQAPTTLSVVAARAGCRYICPDMLTAQSFGQDVIDSQGGIAVAAVLAGIIIAPKNFASSQLHARAWSMDHVLETDHGRSR